jgi:signal transduction histidine kinase
MANSLLHRRFQVFLLVLLGILCVPRLVCAQQQKRVLIFYSEDPAIPSNVILDQSVRAALRNGLPGQLQVYHEGLENFRIPNEKYENELTTLLARKYEGVQIDLLIALGQPALQFCLKYRDNLFGSAAIVFMVQDQSRVEETSLGSNVIGVSGRIELRPSVDLALSFHPETQHVAVVANDSSLGKYMVAQAQKEFAPLQGRIEFIYLSKLTLEELRQALATLPSNSVILYLIFSTDREGRSSSPSEQLSYVAPTANAPIYVVTQPYFLEGVVGGYLISYEAVGKRVGEVGLKILSGTRPEDISSPPVAGVSMFDWRQLRRWGVDEAKIPPGSTVLYKEQTFWEKYKGRILLGVSIMALQALLIAGLLIQRNQRWRATRQLTQREQELRRLTGQLIRVQDEEQRRIAAELHDGLGQSLSIIRNRATLCKEDISDKESVVEQLDEISAAAVSAIEEVREIAHNLRPYELDRLGLTAAIESISAKISDVTPLQVLVDLDSIDGLLSPAAETSLYRIVQEALNNVVKHAEATEVRVGIKRDGGEILVSVHDNGKGMKETPSVSGNNDTGFGLQGIKERAQILRGVYSLDSQPNNGTLLTVRMTLEA